MKIKPASSCPAASVSLRHCLPILTGVLSLAAHAQVAPDAGALRQQIEREQEIPLPRQSPSERPARPEPMRPGAVSVTVREFRFAGNTLLSAEQLAPAVAPYLNRPLDFAQLQAAAAAVANAYRDAGWLVRAYLPRQEVESGIVTIQIVEAVFGGLRLEGDLPRRADAGRVRRLFEARQAVGSPLQTDALDRALLLADDLPGIAVSGTLEEGKGERETNVVLKVAAEPLVYGSVGADNTGSRSTGSRRLTAGLGLASPAGIGDLLTANLLHSEGSDYGRLAYAIPVGADGWRIGVNTSYLSYRLVSDDFRGLRAHGMSDSSGLEATYPLLRSRMANLFVALTLDHKRYDNRANGAATSRYSVDSGGIALNGNLFDSLGGGGANSAGLALTGGEVSLGNLQAGENTTVDGGFTRLRYSLSRQQVITDSLSLLAAWSGQIASRNLDSSEKFYLGGAYGVAAYPASEGGGSEGQLINLELRWRVAPQFTLSAFHDWGRVTVNRDNSYAGAPAVNRYSLKGAGLSLAWQAANGPSVKATLARRIGDNPNPAATGSDQDGTLRKNRFWLTASLPY